MPWFENIPEESGYYWIKQRPNSKPQIIGWFHGIITMLGTRDKISAYYDVYQWSGKIEVPLK